MTGRAAERLRQLSNAVAASEPRLLPRRHTAQRLLSSLLLLNGSIRRSLACLKSLNPDEDVKVKRPEVLTTSSRIPNRMLAKQEDSAAKQEVTTGAQR